MLILNVACWGAIVVVWIAAAIREAGTRSAVRVRGSTEIWTAVVAVVAVAAIVLVGPSIVASFTVEAPWVRMVGAVLLVGSTLFAIWARLALGSSWSVGPRAAPDRGLRTAGPYAITRHPIYTGLLGMLLGSALLGGLGYWIVLVAAGSVVAGLKIRSEERLLLATFPDEYAGLSRRVPMLIPGWPSVVLSTGTIWVRIAVGGVHRRSRTASGQAAAPLTVPPGSMSIVISVTPAPTYLSRAGRPRPDQQPVDRSVAGEHRGGELGDPLPTCPGDALGQEKTADALVLELFGDGDRDFRSARSVGLQAEVPDDQLVIAAMRVDDRDEPLPMVVIGLAEGGALRWRRTGARMQEPARADSHSTARSRTASGRPSRSSGSPGLERRACSRTGASGGQGASSVLIDRTVCAAHGPTGRVRRPAIGGGSAHPHAARPGLLGQLQTGCLRRQLVSEVRVGDRDQRRGAFSHALPEQLGHAPFGDDGPDVGTGRDDARPFLQGRGDPRDGSTGGCRREGDDRSTLGRRERLHG